jgi:osmotically-inducible protein OsmY
MMMTRNLLVLLGTVTLLACERREEKPGQTTTTGAPTETPQAQQPAASAPQPTERPVAQPTAQPTTEQPGARQAQEPKNVEAVRTHLRQEKAAPEAVLSKLEITDENGTIVLNGTVPDKATHEAVVKSAKKAPGVKHVRDNLKMSGGGAQK